VTGTHLGLVSRAGGEEAQGTIAAAGIIGGNGHGTCIARVKGHPRLRLRECLQVGSERVDSVGRRRGSAGAAYTSAASHLNVMAI
jgi:hypothetical protein